MRLLNLLLLSLHRLLLNLLLVLIGAVGCLLGLLILLLRGVIVRVAVDVGRRDVRLSPFRDALTMREAEEDWRRQ